MMSWAAGGNRWRCVAFAAPGAGEERCALVADWYCRQAKEWAASDGVTPAIMEAAVTGRMSAGLVEGVFVTTCMAAGQRRGVRRRWAFRALSPDWPARWWARAARRIDAISGGRLWGTKGAVRHGVHQIGVGLRQQRDGSAARAQVQDRPRRANAEALCRPGPGAMGKLLHCGKRRHCAADRAGGTFWQLEISSWLRRCQR